MFAKNKNVWLLGAITLVVACLAYVRAADVDKDDSANDAKASVSAAQKSYAEAFERLTNGTATHPEECYIWSRRVMDAESRADKGNLRAPYDAAKAHEKRMQDLERIWSKLVKAQVRAFTNATSYYILEAKAIASDASRI